MWLTKRSRVRDTYKSKEWTWPELKTAFHLLLTQKPATLKLFLFVDGLNEYRMLDQFDPSDRCGPHGDSHDPTQAEKIAKGHSEIAKLFTLAARSPTVKLCLSGRPLLVFSDSFRDFAHLRLEHLTFQDISIYVDDTLGNDERLANMTKEEPELRATLIEEIVSKASGVFLWVRLVVDMLLRGLQDRDRIKDLREKLKTIPGELGGRDGLYMRMLKDISPRNRHQGFRLFQIVLHARHNLTALILSFAEEEDTNVAIQLPIKRLSPSDAANRARGMEGRLKSRCAGLLETQPQVKPLEGAFERRANATLPRPHINNEPVVQFLHQTAKEFMEQPDNWTLLLPPDWEMVPDVNVSLLSACLLRLKLIGRTTDYVDLWSAIKDAIHYAAQAEKSLGVSQIELLDALDETVTRFWDGYAGPSAAATWGDSAFVFMRREYERGLHWVNWDPSKGGAYRDRWRSDFMSIAVQGSLTLYLRDKFKRTGYQIKQKPGRPLLRYAVVPEYRHPQPGYDNFNDEPADPCMTQFLLDHQADPNEVYDGPDLFSMREPGSSTWQHSLSWALKELTFGPCSRVSRWCGNTKLLLKYGADPNSIVRSDLLCFSALGTIIIVLWKYPQYLNEITRIMVEKRARLFPGEKDELIAELRQRGGKIEIIATFLQRLDVSIASLLESDEQVLLRRRGMRAKRRVRRNGSILTSAASTQRKAKQLSTRTNAPTYHQRASQVRSRNEGWDEDVDEEMG